MARYEDPEVPKTVTILIQKMLDEDSTNPPGTAQKAADELLDRSVKVGRDSLFKEAMRFWKRSHNLPEEVIWQWFNGVFKGNPKGGNSRKYKPRRGRAPKNKE